MVNNGKLLEAVVNSANVDNTLILFQDQWMSKKEVEVLREQMRKDSEARLGKLLEEARVSALEDILPPKIALELINKSGGFDIWGTCGNFSAVIGKAKSRKSFLINLALSAATQGNLFLNQIKSNISHKPEVMCFDTEQGRYHVQLALKRICTQTGISNPEHLHVYGLRKYTPAERLEAIEFALYQNRNVGLVVIDGVKDLITSINDEDQATMIVSKLLKWTEELDIHIITVLHQNKSDTNARGHLGTELVNKAETVLSVTKADGDNMMSLVEPQQCRNREPEPFAFEIIDGLPVLATNYQMRAEVKSHKIDVEDIEGYEMFKVLIEVFNHDSSYGYGKMIPQMKLAFKKVLDKTIGNNKLIEILTHSKNRGWVIQDKDGGPYKLGEYIQSTPDTEMAF